MAAEIRTVAMATKTRLRPSPMDLSALAKDAVCHVCSKQGHVAKDCWYKTKKEGGKGQKGKKSQRKGTKPKDGDIEKKNACEVGHFVRECAEKKETNNASSGGGVDVHCLTYTDDQSQWIMMFAEVGQIRGQSSNIEFFVDPCVSVQSETWFTPGGTFLIAKGAAVESQGSTEV